VHLALLLAIITAVRACGGVNQAEDRLSAATRWTAERTGLNGAKETLDTKVRPSMDAATHSLADAIYSGTSRMMDAAELALRGSGAWLGQQVGSLGSVGSGIRTVLTPNTPKQPQPADDPASDKERRASPAP
jgi:hypothetical protein